MNKRGLVLKNIWYGVGSKLILIVVSMVTPRLLMDSYGSEINGLLSTITQVFSYFTLLEGGIGLATVNALYRPIDENDVEKANVILGQARSYYRKVSFFYAGLVIIFAIAYSITVSSSLSRPEVLLVVLFQGVSRVVTYYYCAVNEQLLTASGRRYVVENALFLTNLGSMIVRVALILLGNNIVMVQALFALVSLIRVPLILAYTKRMFVWLNIQTQRSYSLLKEKSAFIIHEISSMVFFNTDIIIVSVFCGLAEASVYSLYGLVFGSLNMLINAANGGLGFLFGQNHYKKSEDFIKIYDSYSIIHLTLIFSIMTPAYLLIAPFVQLYTKGISDTNYLLNYLPILFTLINIMSAARTVPARLIAITGHARATQRRSVLEAVLNILASLVLVQFYGIQGVLIGSIIALLYRMNDIIIYANTKILERKINKDYKNLFVYASIFAFIALLGKRINFEISGLFQFILLGLLTFAICSILYIFAFLALEPSLSRKMWNQLTKR